MRPSSYQYYLDVAHAVSLRSHDAETKVGSILVNEKTGAIISTGYNGFIRGANDDRLPNTRPDKYEYMIHSEMNLVLNCAKHGISTDGCMCVGTLSPCPNCARMLWQSGIDKMIFKSLHPTFETTKKLLDLGVMVIEGDGYYVASFYAGRGVLM